MDRCREAFAKNARDIYGLDNGATVPHTVDYNGLRGDGSRAPDKLINPGDFTWMLHNYWMHYRYSMDHTLVTDEKTHALFSLLKKSINVYLHTMKKGADGKYHLPVWMTPEYGKVADNNYNLSLLRWGCQTLLDLNKRYNLSDPLATRWKDVLKNLTPYPVDKTGYMMGKDMPMTKSHRHWQHLQMLFPLYLVDLNDPAKRTLAKKSIRHWLTVDNSRQIYGWSGAAASSLYSALGDGDNALKYLLNHHNQKRFVMSNTMYLEISPVIECALVAARSLQDMLLQSHGDMIRVFPAMPDVWKDAVFRDLRTEGAFLVTARRAKGKLVWVKLQSLAGEPCIVRADFATTPLALGGRKFKLKPLGKSTWQIDLKKGETVVLTADAKGPFLVAPLEADAKQCNFYGLNSNGK